MFPMAKESNTDLAPNLQQDNATSKLHPRHDDIVQFILRIFDSAFQK